MSRAIVSSLALAAATVNGLDVVCSTPPLGVEYDIDYYSGKAGCGTVLLEADIGGGINVEPTISWQLAEPGRFYTLLYIDPDATSGGSWPDGVSPGEHAPVRHWVAGNIAGASLLSGNLTMATQVQPFKGPSPPSGSHRYVQWLFEHAEPIDFEAMPDSIIQWDYETFIEKHQLGMPVASNWHVTQYAAPRDATGNAEGLNAPRGGVNLNCSAHTLHVEYDIKYYSGFVDCGTLLLESDIGGGINVAPYVGYAYAKSSDFYTLIYVDPDADMAGSWPNVTAAGGHAPVRHWVVGNILGEALNNRDLSQATTVSAFKGPSPPSGSHRYGQWLFRQSSGMIDFETLDDNARTNWDYEAFIALHQLGEIVASNWHVTQHMEARNVSSIVI